MVYIYIYIYHIYIYIIYRYYIYIIYIYIIYIYLVISPFISLMVYQWSQCPSHVPFAPVLVAQLLPTWEDCGVVKNWGPLISFGKTMGFDNVSYIYNITILYMYTCQLNVSYSYNGLLQAISDK
jgi:hypothetical protein